MTISTTAARIGFVGTIALMGSSACRSAAPIPYSVKPEAPVQSSSIQSIPVPFMETDKMTVTHYFNLKAAVAPFLKSFRPVPGQPPKVLGVGGIHQKMRSTLLSTDWTFATEFLPEAYDAGFKYLIYEPQLSGPEALKDAEQYMQTGIFGKALNEWYRGNSQYKGYWDYCGIIQVYKQARTVRNRDFYIFGSNVANREEFDRYKEKPVEDISPIINENTYHLARAFYKRGESVITVNGIVHVLPNPAAGQERWNYGGRLRAEIGSNYKVALIVKADYLDGWAGEKITCSDIQVDDCEKLVPAEGVNHAYIKEDGKNVYFIARSKMPIVPIDPDAPQICP